jgi:hypothetical protein
MNNVIKILMLSFLLPAAGDAGMGDVLTSWPAPASTFDRVNGIAFEGDYIWVKDRVCESRGVVKSTKSGSVLGEIAFPFHGYGSSYGLTFDGEYLWTVYRQPVGIDRCDHYVQYTTNGSVASVFWAHKYPLYYPSVAISWDGQYLWTDERRTGIGTRAGKYTTTGTLIGTFSVAGVWRTDAAYYNNQLWTGGNDGYIYGMNVGASTFVASFAAPGGSCYAVGFDGEYLWTADRNTPQYIYKVDIDVVDVNPGSFGKIKGMFR